MAIIYSAVVFDGVPRTYLSCAEIRLIVPRRTAGCSNGPSLPQLSEYPCKSVRKHNAPENHKHTSCVRPHFKSLPLCKMAATAERTHVSMDCGDGATKQRSEGNEEGDVRGPMRVFLREPEDGSEDGSAAAACWQMRLPGRMMETEY